MNPLTRIHYVHLHATNDIPLIPLYTRMLLVSDTKYDPLYNYRKVLATGDLVCYVCGRASRDIHHIRLYEDKPFIRVVSFLDESISTHSSEWYVTQDLGLVCSPECKDVNDLLGGMAS